jgi:hypothetical protein
METSFTLKQAVIGGQTAPDDWSVLLNGEAVGRIHPVVGNAARSEDSPITKQCMWTKALTGPDD